VCDFVPRSLTVPFLVSAKIGDKAGVEADWGGEVGVALGCRLHFAECCTLLQVICVMASFCIVLMYFTLNEVTNRSEM
jgi:hypothetical protein